MPGKAYHVHMNAAETSAIKILRNQHAAFCADLYTRHPGQVVNRANHEQFRSEAKLGKAKRRISLKGAAAIEPGGFVLFAQSTSHADCVSVWAPGISALVQSAKIVAV
jgi:hypothetical protein